jgi:tRNA pseudouridine38-40 synthase
VNVANDSASDDSNDVAAGLPLPADPASHRTLKLTLSYDGTNYFGWQYQPDRPTVQGTLEAALRQVTQEQIRVAGSGRTDAGVHALGQVASFQTRSRLPVEVLHKALNATLPHDVAVVEVCEAPPGFHAIRDCVRKTYRYVLHDGPVRDVFSRQYAWHVWHRLDECAMRRAAEALVGTHDFASFQTQGTERESTVRTVFDLSVERASHLVAVEVTADGFLYNMVRTIVGTLVKVGRGQRGESWPAEVLAARDRRLAGMTAPPHGLFLVRAEYEKRLIAN